MTTKNQEISAILDSVPSLIIEVIDTEVAAAPGSATTTRRRKRISPAATTPMLAKEYDGQNPRGWWMSEKLDGVRAIWDGSKLVSRNGNVFHAPSWFIDDLPDGIALDGELWEGHGMFQKTVGKIRAKHGDWGNITFMIFDTLCRDPFSDRFNEIATMDLPGHCQIVAHTKCDSAKHLARFENNILKLGGEGVMLRDPDSAYENKRSSSLLKVKRFTEDEAEVIGYTDGKGKHKGKIGALICRYMGETFQIGTGLSDALRNLPPTIGSLVTFSFFGETDGGIPRHASFVAVRDYE